MIRTKVTRMLALAGFVPAGKPVYATRQERSCYSAQNRGECRSRSRRSPQHSRLLWLACALAATGTAPAHAQTAREGVVHNFGFPNPADGLGPTAGVLPDSEGNLYGTTSGGGAAGNGTVYKVDSTGRETVLYSFTGGPDGGNPYAGVIRDPAGHLYGTTRFGGTANAGVVYKLDTAGNPTVLYPFTGGDDGSGPIAGVIRDSAGNLYGTTGYGGDMNCGVSVGCGVVYMLDTAGHQTVLHTFMGGADGQLPVGLIRDSVGNLYGTTANGGSACCGVVFRLDRSGHEKVLHAFTGGNDGGNPGAGVIRDSEGNLYGTTIAGGTDGFGVVYKLDTAGQETALYSFTGAADGGNPIAGVIRDSAGNLYGTTLYGGNLVNCPATEFTPAGCGVVFKLDTAGNETVLYSFTGGADGGVPDAGVIRDPAGNLFGTTLQGGKKAGGVVFALKPR